MCELASQLVACKACTAENDRLREENRRLIQVAIDSQDALRRALERIEAEVRT